MFLNGFQKPQINYQIKTYGSDFVLLSIQNDINQAMTNFADLTNETKATKKNEEYSNQISIESLSAEKVIPEVNKSSGKGKNKVTKWKDKNSRIDNKHCDKKI